MKGDKMGIEKWRDIRDLLFSHFFKESLNL